MTYQDDFTLSAALTDQAFLEQLSTQGLGALPDLFPVLLNAAMQIERRKDLGAAPHERTPERMGYANGYKDKTFNTRLGQITVAVPNHRKIMGLAKQYTETTHKARYTEAEYFEIERVSEGRWEYVNGQVRLMAGGSDDHAMIPSNIGRLLGNALVPRGSRVYVDNMKLHTGDGVNTFPDVSVVRGDRQYYLGKDHVIINSLLIVEVLSPSTRDYDQGDKFRHYQTLESLQEYLLGEPNTPEVRLYRRREEFWEFREIVGMDGAITLRSVEVSLALAEVYALIEFQPETEPLTGTE